MDAYATEKAIGTDETLLLRGNRVLATFAGPDHAAEAANIAELLNAQLGERYEIDVTNFPP